MRTSGTRTLTALAISFVAVVALPWAVSAADQFVDVPDSNIFHDDISWMAEAGVTRGCNPPANTEFCPEDNVTRQQMAAFMRRLAEGQVVDAATVEGHRAVDLGVTITGLAAPDSMQLQPLIATAMGEVELQAMNGEIAHVTTSVRVAAVAGVDVFTWVQANDPECTLDKPRILGSEASLPTHSSTAGSQSLLAHTAFVTEIEDDTILTLCGRANIAAIPTVEVFTMNAIQSHKGSLTLLPGSVD